MKSLAPHLRNALRAIRRLQRADGWGALFGAISAQLPLGIVVLDADGRIVTLNASAESMLATGDGLSAARHGLTASNSAVRQALEARIATAIATALGTDGAGGATLRVPRPSGRRAYVLDIVPIVAPPAIYPRERVVAVVLITDPERDDATLPRRLQSLLELTPREARLAATLGSGHSIESAAPALGLSVATARTYLKHVFQKTGTHRQSELVALVRRLAQVDPKRAGERSDPEPRHR
jgi:DNA-binding CsgD family transcriptional regulator